MQKKQDKNYKQKGVGFFENPKTKEPFDLEKNKALKEKEIRQGARYFFERKRIEEKVIWSAEQQKVALEIKTLQEELKKLVHETGDLSREIKKATIQTIIEPGVYHLNFLGRLLDLVRLLRKRVQESQTWLFEWNSYCKKKRNYYWSQVQKSGTKFMLSSERYMATQAG